MDYNCLVNLRLFYQDQNAEFKSLEQAQALAAVVKRETDVLAVLSTGGGKSLLFFLPAFIEREQQLTTVVVVPLVALTADMSRRCAQHGLSFDVWRGTC